jgi:hypothetical protein
MEFSLIALHVFSSSELKIYWSPSLSCFLSHLIKDKHLILIRDGELFSEMAHAKDHAKKLIPRKWSYDLGIVPVTPSQIDIAALLATNPGPGKNTFSNYRASAVL